MRGLRKSVLSPEQAKRDAADAAWRAFNASVPVKSRTDEKGYHHLYREGEEAMIKKWGRMSMRVALYPTLADEQHARKMIRLYNIAHNLAGKNDRIAREGGADE